jgi:hypothetical protein
LQLLDAPLELRLRAVDLLLDMMCAILQIATDVAHRRTSTK